MLNFTTDEQAAGGAAAAWSVPPKPANIEDEKKIIKDLESDNKLKAGQTWYLLSARWWKQWKEYVHYDWYSQSGFNTTKTAPPSIDNTLFIEDEEPGSNDHKVRKSAMENYDYTLITEPMWQCLHSWYSGGPALPRKVIAYGYQGANKVVEVRPLYLKIFKSSALSEVVIVPFSKCDTVRYLRDTMAVKLNVNPEEVRVWDFHGNSKYKLLDDLDKKLEEAQIIDNQPILLEEKDENGQFPEIPKTRNTFSTGTSYMSGYYGGYSNYNTPTDPGTTGLVNLGNTCFMNSSLQCLSNTQPLTEYFKSDNYKVDINSTNPLGMKGELAEEYANLCKSLWAGNVSAVAPRDFKYKLERFAPAFSGYQQHDSQELLSFLLDGLHEDLNRVKTKPYRDRPETQEKGDVQFSEDLWNYHKERNDSIIVDWFQGQLKSTLVCPKCSKKSVTFDPVMYLSLPLPIKMTRVVNVTVFPINGDRPTKYACEVNKYGNIVELKQCISKYNGMKVEDLVITDVYSSKFFKVFQDKESIDVIQERDFICVYEIKNLEDQDYLHIPVLLRRDDVSGSSSFMSRKSLFGFPFILTIPDYKNITYKQLYALVNNHLSRYIKIQRVSSSSNLNEQDQTEDSNEDTEDEEEFASENVSSKKRKSHPPFVLKLVDNYGQNDEETLLDDDKPITELKERSTLGVIWNSKDYESYYDDSKERDIEQHSSLQTVVDKDEEDTVDLSTCLNLFTEEEQLGPDDTWYCSNCKDHVQAFKKFDLWKLPPMLVIHLKRFSYKKKYWREKLETFVDFPLHDLDLSQFAQGPQSKPPVYELYAVSNHYGSLGGGHYTAYAKNFQLNNWYKFDDSSVSRIEEDKSRTSNAYVLFYRRKDTLEETTATTTSTTAEPSTADTQMDSQMDTDSSPQETPNNEDKMEEVSL